MKRIATHRSARLGPAQQGRRFLSLVLAAGVLLVCAPRATSAATLVEVRSTKHADFTRVVFETDGPIWYSLENRSRETGEIELIIPVTSTETTVRDLDLPARSVGLEALPDNSGSRALLKVEGPLDIWTNQLQDPPRIVLDLRVADQSAPPGNLGELDYEVVGEGDEEPTPMALPSVAAAKREAASHARNASSKDSASLMHHPLFWILAVCLAVGLLIALYVRRVSRRDIVRRAPATSDRAATSRARQVGPRSFQVGGALPKATAMAGAAREKAKSVKERIEEKVSAKKTVKGSETTATTHANKKTETTEVTERASSAPKAPAQALQGETMSAATLESNGESAAVPAAPERSAAAASAGSAQQGGGYFEVLELLRRLDDRLAKLEGDFSSVRDEQGQLRDRSLAQAEEIRAHRAAVARLLRRPAAHSGRPGVGPSSS